MTLVVRRKDVPEPEPVSPTAHLEEKKKAIYENLRDLQFEYRMNKLSDQDYQQTKLELQRQLAGVLAEMEKIQKSPAAATRDGAPIRDGAPSRDRQGAVKPQPVWVCPNCSTQFTRPMKFCGECGRAMVAS